jgi:hypothetical protein
VLVTNQDKGVVDLEFNENDRIFLNGIGEYGYGFWSKWLRTGPTYMVTKAPWYSLARLTANRNHGDAGAGDRGLATWIGPGYYHFTTYTSNNANMVLNINYDNHLDGEWNYLYYSYKRLTLDTGSAKGWIYFS